MASEATKAVGVTIGCLHIEIKLTDQGPVVIEVNGRPGGGMSEMLERTLGETVEVRAILTEGAWPAFADPTELEQAVLNLCVNARDALPGGGRIIVETGNAILREIDGRSTVNTIAARLAERYGAPEAAVMSDVRDFLGGLVAQRLVDYR